MIGDEATVGSLRSPAKGVWYSPAQVQFLSSPLESDRIIYGVHSSIG